MTRIVRDFDTRDVPVLSTRTHDGAPAFFEAVGFLHVDTIDPYPGGDVGNPCALLVMPIRRDRPA